MSTSTPSFAEIVKFAEHIYSLQADNGGKEYKVSDNVVIGHVKTNDDIADDIKVSMTDTNIQYMLMTDDDRRVQHLAIRGTYDFTTALVDLDCLPSFDDELGIYVHNGFLKAARTILTAISPKLKDGYTMTMSAHSLGSLVVIIAMLMKVRGLDTTKKNKIGRIITFGAPKMFTMRACRAKKFADLNILRVINDNDIVPSLPKLIANSVLAMFTCFNGGYRQFGAELTLDSKTGTYKYRTAQEVNEDYIANSIFLALYNNSVEVHDLTNYIASLQPFLEKGRAPKTP